MSLSAERQADQLMAEAYTEHWDLAHQFADSVNRIGHGCRVTRAIRQEYAVRLERQHIDSRHCGRNDCHMAAAIGQQTQDVVLDPEIVGDYVRRCSLATERNRAIGLSLIPCSIHAVFPYIGKAAS